MASLACSPLLDVGDASYRDGEPPRLLAYLKAGPPPQPGARFGTVMTTDGTSLMVAAPAALP